MAIDMKKFTVLLILAVSITGCKKESGGGARQEVQTPIPQAPVELPQEEIPNDPPEPQDLTPNPVPDPNLPSYPFNFDKETLGGIKIESNNNNMPSLNNIDTWYTEVRQCIADWYDALYPTDIFEFVSPPPVIIYNNSIVGYCGSGHGLNGIYCTNYYVPFVVLETGWSQFEFMWKHEFTHHILYMNGLGNQINFGHLPDEIWNCQYQ